MRFQLLAASLIAGASAFAPARAPVNRAIQPRMAKDEIVPVTEDSTKATVAAVGFLAGFAAGGPILGAVGAAATNYVATKVQAFKRRAEDGMDSQEAGIRSSYGNVQGNPGEIFIAFLKIQKLLRLHFLLAGE